MEYTINDKIIIIVDGNEYQAVIDEIQQDKILCHVPPKHYGLVYTARLYEFPRKDLGKSWRLLNINTPEDERLYDPTPKGTFEQIDELNAEKENNKCH